MELSSLMHVNLGCGGEPRAGMVNVDRMGHGAQVRMDALDLGFDDGSVGRLEAFHLVEHLGWVGCTYALCEWFRVMAPGATLVIETPDLLQTAREFAAASLPRRALLASWIYGLESPGMNHVFGFEYVVLRDLLASCGFVDIRRRKARTHPSMPGLRVEARRGRDPAQQVHASFKRLVRSRGLAPANQPVAVELHETIARGLVRATSTAAERGQRMDDLLASLAVHDPDIARAALDAASLLLPRARIALWNRVLADPDAAETLALQVQALRSMPVMPGQMSVTYRAVRDTFRARFLQRVARRRIRTGSGAKASGALVVKPFSVAGLSVEAQAQLSRGLRCFVDEDSAGAQRHFELASTFNSNLPIAFWNLARIAVSRGDRRQAMAWLDAALQAATRGASSCAPRLAIERKRLASGRPVAGCPVHPSDLAMGSGS